MADLAVAVKKWSQIKSSWRSLLRPISESRSGIFRGLMLNRIGIALLGCDGHVDIGLGVTTADAVSYVNWPTICLLFGFFVISAQLRLSGFYDKVAAGLADLLGHPARFLLILMLVSGGLSAFLNNDVVCYVFAPITGIALLRKQINPVPFLIAR